MTENENIPTTQSSTCAQLRQLCGEFNAGAYMQGPEPNGMNKDDALDWAERIIAHVPALLDVAEAAQLKRNVVLEDEAALEGKWVAIPMEDFDALRATFQKLPQKVSELLNFTTLEIPRDPVPSGPHPDPQPSRPNPNVTIREFRTPHPLRWLRRRVRRD